MKNPFELGFSDIVKVVGEMVQDIDDNDPGWVTHRSFFMSLSLNMELDLSEQAKSATPLHQDYYETKKASEIMPFVFGKFKKFDPKINQLKVYHGEKEMRAEADKLKA